LILILKNKIKRSQPAAAPTGDLSAVLRETGLPAKAAGQVTWILPMTASSLASQLPQKYGLFARFAFSHRPCGSWLASDGDLTFNIDFD
jgi:hypothetical protein